VHKAGQDAGSGKAGRAWSDGKHGRSRGLLVSVLASLLLHWVLLLALRPLAARKTAQAPLPVLFTASLLPAPSAGHVAPPPAAVPTVPAEMGPAVTAPSPVEPAPAIAAVPAAPAALPSATVDPKANEEAAPPPAPAAVPGPTESSGAADKSAPEQNGEPVFLGKDEWSTPPLPQDGPDTSKLTGTKLVARKLLVRIRIDQTGTVTRAEVVPYEIRPEVAALLARMVSGVRFTPATLDAKPVASEIITRLCFDDGGKFETEPEGCWSFAPEPKR
jgi:hypothetical protein